MLQEPETAPPVRLSAAETRFLNGLRSSRPDLAEPFISNLPRARRGATHRLLQGFLMEGICGEGPGPAGELRVPLPGGRTLRHPCSRRYLSGRFDPAGGEALLAGAGGVERVESPSRLLEVFAEEALLPEGADPTRFRSELENGVANHALSLVGARRRQRELAATARGLGTGSSLALARALAGEIEGFSPLAFFEQLVSEGHPLHPCAKLKAGLAAEEAVRYSPEWGVVVDLALAAVREDVCREVSCDGSLREILLGEHPGAGRAFEAVLREGVDSHLEPGDLPVAGCALYAESPVTGKTVLAELVEARARATGAASLQEAAVSFVGEYAGIAVPGFLTLMSVYGVGLEGHLQNCVPVFRQGRPAKLLFRDWGGARIHAGRLERSGIEANLAPGSLTLADSVGEMRRKVLYTVFQNHLGEVVLRASKGFGVPERELWREVRRACEEVFQVLASRPGSAPDTLSDRSVLYAPEIPHKALTRMRLDPGKGDLYVNVPNPLCKAGQQEKRGGS